MSMISNEKILETLENECNAHETLTALRGKFTNGIEWVISLSKAFNRFTVRFYNSADIMPPILCDGTYTECIRFVLRTHKHIKKGGTI